MQPRNYRISTSNNPPLRIGLLLDSVTELPAFSARIVEDIRASNFAEIVLLVLRKTPQKSGKTEQHLAKRSSLLHHIADQKLRKRILYDIYLKLDARRRMPDDPTRKVPCGELLAGIEVLEVEPIGKKFIHRFPEDALEKIRSLKLDVLIRFGFNILHGGILQAARCGVWSYHHGDNEFYRGGPPYFWELREGALLSGAILQVLSEELDGGLVLCKSLFATERTISASRNRYAPYWGSADMVIRKLNELHRLGWDALQETAIPSEQYKGERPIYKTPGNLDMLPWLGPTLLKKAVLYPFRKPRVQHWRIATRVNATPLYEDGGERIYSGFRWIESPKGHFWADPFLFEHNGKYWVFFEDYSYREKRAVIACSEILANGDLGPATVCLEEANRHFSYPHIFRAGSEIFMIPESCDSNSINLYRCLRFPDQWAHHASLLEGKFVDTTVWEHGGLWWMATTSAEFGARAGPLLLFFAESLTGNWRFHPANPICTDIRRNRGSGRIFCSQGRLIRPSQSCAPSYGYSFGFNEITELSAHRYSEKPLMTVTPEHWKGISGVHTYNAAGQFEVIDGCVPLPLKRVLA